METPLCPTLGHTVPRLVRDSRRPGFSPQLSKRTQSLLSCFLWAPKPACHPELGGGDSHLGERSILVLQASCVPATVSGQGRVPGSERPSACLESP